MLSRGLYLRSERVQYRQDDMAQTLLTPRQAAERLGISYPALKHWILAGRVRTIKTPGGHHRIPVEALNELLPQPPEPARSIAQTGTARVSGRNQLAGTVLEIVVEGLLAKVVLTLGSGHEVQRITAIITADAVHELALKPGEQALALIKATEVMIGKP